MRHLPVLLIVTPLFFAFLLPVFSMYIERKYKSLTLLGTLTITALAIASFYTVPNIYPVGGWQAPLGIILVIDEASSIMTFFLAVVFGLVIKYSFHFIHGGGARYYYTVLFLLWASLNGMIITGDLFNMIVFIEISSAVTYALIAWDATPRALEAAFKYMFIGTLGAFFIILATVIIYNTTGNLNIASAAAQVDDIPPRALTLAIVLYITGFAAKLALIPAHWLADGHFVAPPPVSALLSGGAMKVALFALFRLLYSLFGWEIIAAAGADNLLLGMGFATALLGAILAFGQSNLKRMLAFSTITQIGFIVMVMSLGTQSGLRAGFYHMINHGMMKGALFLSMGTMTAVTGSEELAELNGMGRVLPLQGMAFVAGTMAIIGIPIFNGFFSKWLIGENLVGHSPLLIISLIGASFLGVIYYFRALKVLYNKADVSINPPRGQSGPTLAFALLCLILGIYPYLPLLGFDRAALAFLRYTQLVGSVSGL